MNSVSRAAALGAVAVWCGALGWWWAPLILPAVRAVGWIGTRAGLVLVVLFAAGLVTSSAHDAEPPPLPVGEVAVAGRVELVLDGNWGERSVVRTNDGRVLVVAERPLPSGPIRITGQSNGRPVRVAGRWVRASIRVDRVETDPGARLHDRLAEVLRRRVTDTIRPERSEARALLNGFLVGDTSEVGAVAMDEMRRTGLSHLVAVSGSNVALFLVALIAVTAPLSIHPATRLLVVANGLLVFGALTRWEPSVVRASATAMVVGLTRFTGVPLEPAAVLALVAGGGVLVDPGLSGSLGFQLSVLATAGLLVGSRLGGGGGPIRTLVVATLAAQVAVAPLLLVTFGEMPLLSPLANLVAIPVVTAATVLAGAGAVIGVDPVIAVAEAMAAGVMLVARWAAPLPQLGPPAAVIILLLGLAWWRRPDWRSGLAAVTVAGCLFLLAGGPDVPDRGVVVLDVGQGDAVLVLLDGFTVLVDGGPDPARLVSRLASYGVDRIDLMVASHVHADHVEGLIGALERIPVGRLWAAFEPHQTPSSLRLLESARAEGVPVERPPLGIEVVVGSDSIRVVGPQRRYDGPNDQSIVLLVTIEETRTLLAGDIEVVAQGELTVADVDVLKVPHQGAATSDPDWLRSHAGAVAVISVGPNSFGHPASWVVDELEQAGSEVLRTDLVGDVVLDETGLARLRANGSDADGE